MFGGAAIRVEAVREAIGGFGPLKAVLGAVYANYEVRSRLPAQRFSLTNSSAGNCHHWKQD